MTELKPASNQALATAPVPPAQLPALPCPCPRAAVTPPSRAEHRPAARSLPAAAAPASVPLRAGERALPGHVPMAGAGKLVPAGLPGSSGRTAPSLPRAIEPRNRGCRLNRLAGPALPARGSIQLPLPTGHWGTMGLDFSGAGEPRGSICLPFPTSLQFIPAWQQQPPTHHAQTPRGANAFPPCSHSSELLPGSATHLSSARRALPARPTAAEVIDLQASAGLGVPLETTSAAAGAREFNAIDTGHQPVFVHASAACRTAVLERWQNKQRLSQRACHPSAGCVRRQTDRWGNGALP